MLIYFKLSKTKLAEMKNTTNPILLSKLSDIAIAKLQLIPDWVANNHTSLLDQDYEVLEGGQITLTVRIGQTCVLKIFVPKFKWITTTDQFVPLLQNYQALVNSNIDLNGLDILEFNDFDNHFLAPTLLIRYHPNTKPLSDIFYTFEQSKKSQVMNKLVALLKSFHLPITNFEYSTQRLINEFDKEFAKHKDKISHLELEIFEKLRKQIKPKILKSDIFLVHGDIHLENILVDKDDDLHLIDFDFCQFGPRFLEMEVIFLFCFLPTALVTEQLEPHYSAILESEFDQITTQYPELYPKEFENEIKLLFATQLLSKINNPKFKDYCTNAISKLFLELAKEIG
jgi:hypothetical protein